MAENQKKLKHLFKKRKISYDLRCSIPLYGMCIIPVLLVFIFSYLPMFGIVIAFKDYRYASGIWGSEWVGLDNFKFFLKSDDFLRITWNTLRYNFIFIIAGTIGALILAILLYQLTSRTKTKIFQTVMITPHFMSWVIVGSMVYAILQPQSGFLNTILEGLGMERIDCYSMPKAWTPIFIVSYLWKHIGMDSVIYYAALMGIDQSLFEAATIDGANKRQTILHIMVPSIMMLIVTMTILKIGNIFRADFGMFYQLTGNIGMLYSTTDVVDTYIFRSMREIGDMGMSSAVGVLQSVVGFVLVVCTNALSKKVDEDYGLF